MDQHLHTSGTGDRAESTDHQFVDGLVRIATPVPILEGFHHEETDRLV